MGGRPAQLPRRVGQAGVDLSPDWGGFLTSKAVFGVPLAEHGIDQVHQANSREVTY